MADTDLVGQGMPRTEARRLRLEHWQVVLDKQAASKLSPTEFCREASISVHAFYWWRRQVRQWTGGGGPACVRRPKGPRATFLEVKRGPPDPGGRAYPFEVDLKCSRRLRIGAGFDPVSLQALVRALEALPC